MIRETIVTTRAADGGTHAAPIGVRDCEDGMIIAPFRPSATLDNLARARCAAVNCTDDVRVFAGCLTGRRDWPMRPCADIEVGRLAGALAHCELRVARIEEDETRPRFFCEVLRRETHAPFAGFNRAQAAVIEFAVLISRLHLLPPEQIRDEAARLRVAVDKTAGERERVAWDWLDAKLRARLDGAAARAAS